MTAQEIRGKTFEKVVFSGYDAGAVQTFLYAVSKEFEQLQDEKAKYAESIKTLSAKVSEYRNKGAALQEAYVTATQTAQETAQRIIDDARREASQLLENAEAGLHDRVRDLKQEIQMREDRLEELKQQTIEATYGIQKLVDRLGGYVAKINEVAFAQEQIREAKQKEAYETIARSVQQAVSGAETEPQSQEQEQEGQGETQEETRETREEAQAETPFEAENAGDASGDSNDDNDDDDNDDDTKPYISVVQYSSK